MWYINKKTGIRVWADSKEKAKIKMRELIEFLSFNKPIETNAMSNSKKELESTILGQVNNIVSWWCLCWYLKNVENKNNLLNHEKGKLREALIEIRKEKFNGKDRPDVKKKIVVDLFINKNKFLEHKEKIIRIFKNKFKDEHIKQDTTLFNKIASNFQKELPKLITLMCEWSEEEIKDYIENKCFV